MGPSDAQTFGDALRDGAALRLAVASGPELAALLQATTLIATSLERGGKLFLFGNGGSAADAQHIAAELVGRLTIDRRPIAALALTTDTSALTAIGNDFGYEWIFERQLRALGTRGDTVIAITTSGKSQSVLRGAAAARELGLGVVGFTGRDGTHFAQQCDVAFVAPTRETARIQELHITAGHLIASALECHLAGVRPPPPLFPNGRSILTREEAVAVRNRYRELGRSVVWTNGCFDLFHAGHLASLRAAKAEGDVLFVGVNSDASVRRLKGEGRPFIGQDDRARLLSELSVVDHVLVFEEDTPGNVLAAVQPDVHVKGADYQGRVLPERDVVERHGGRIAFSPLVAGLSSSELVRRIRA